ncbi:MAG: ATP synthase F0 subunit B [Cyanobacteria bacterium]|nr:ATP synthase F0 subunit B [Cyanobacteriota bacterium]
MVSINFTAVIFALSFIGFLYLMKFVFFDKVAAVIDQREGHIKDKLVASRKAQERIEQEIENQNPKELLAQAKSSSSSILNDAMNIATKDKDKLVNAAKTEFNSKLEASLTSLKKEETELRKSIDSIVTELVATTVDKLISELNTKEKALN